MPAMRNVLMIAFHFPPEGGSSGVLRTLKFSKYLPEFGWRPTVITAVPSAYGSTDPGLMKDISNHVEVIRAFCFDAKRLFSFRKRYIGMVTVPDRYVSWLPFAVRAALRQIARHKYELIYSTCPIPTAHLVACLCQSLTGLRWVADFRDPWIEDIQYSGYSRLRFHVERSMEATVVKRCTLLTVTTDLLREELHARYPALPAQKIEVVSNGFDEQDFETLDDIEPPCTHVLEIVHSGHVNPDYRNPICLMQAISRLVQTRQIPESEIRLIFLGGGYYLKSEAFQNQVNTLALQNVVEVVDRMPYAQSLRRLHAAGVLLILQGGYDTRHLIPAKAFEYLRTGRPILALTGDGVTARLVREFDAGYIVAIDDVDGICRVLLQIHRHFSHGTLNVRVDLDRLRGGYSRRNLTASLAGLFDRLSEPRL